MSRQIYNDIAERLNNVDFAQIAAGFHRFPFALYDQARVWLEDGEIPYDRRFLGNTSIEFDGKLTAIWGAEYAVDDLGEWAADMVHEMFHAFQTERGETRYPDDLQLLAYPRDVKNHCERLSENRLLAAAYNGDEAAYQAFCASRAWRAGLIGEFAEQEERAELIEGGAEFAGCKALKMLSPQKFGERMADYVKKITTVDETFFDIRRVAYWTGTLKFFVEERFGKLDGVKYKAPHVSDEDKRVVTEAIKARDDAIDAAFNSFYAKPRRRLTGKFEICGYDPMNMVMRRNEILCTRFVMLKEGGGEARFFEGPALVTRGATVSVMWGEEENF